MLVEMVRTPPSTCYSYSYCACPLHGVQTHPHLTACPDIPMHWAPILFKAQACAWTHPNFLAGGTDRVSATL